MTTVQFYHLTTTLLERALPKLLEKAYAGGFKVLLVANSEDRVEQLNQALWTYNPGSFLPHGSIKEGNAEKQPILLITSDKLSLFSPRLRGELEGGDMPASGGVKAFNLLAVVDGMTPEKPEAFERIIDMFDGNDPQAVEKARQRWTLYKNAGHTMSYLRQNESGGWETRMQ